MWFCIVLIVSMSLATCPNGCSGHGKCNNEGHCECFKQVGLSTKDSPAFTGYDCSQRACPFGQPFSATLDWKALKTDTPITLEGGETSLRMLQQRCSITDINTYEYYNIEIDNYGKLAEEGGKASVYSEGNYIGKCDILKAENSNLVVKFNFNLTSPSRRGFNMTFKVSEERNDLSLYYITKVKGNKIVWRNEYIDILGLYTESKKDNNKYKFACYNGDDILKENEVKTYDFTLNAVKNGGRRMLQEPAEPAVETTAATTAEATTQEATTAEATTAEATTQEATTTEATTAEATTAETTTTEATTAEVTTQEATTTTAESTTKTEATTTPAVETTTAEATTTIPTTLEPTLTPCTRNTTDKQYQFETESNEIENKICHLLYSLSNTTESNIDDFDVKNWLFKKGDKWYYGTETDSETVIPPITQIKVQEEVKNQMIKEPEYIYIPKPTSADTETDTTSQVTNSLFIGAKITVTVITNSSISRQIVTVVSIEYEYNVNGDSRMRLLADDSLDSKYLRIKTSPPLDIGNDIDQLIIQITNDSHNAHENTECSNQGLCNRETGECQCFDGFEGIACQRVGCPNNCNNNGRCVSISQALGVDEVKGNTQFKSESLFACKCDPGRRGPDCSLLECPSGKDPLGGTNKIGENNKPNNDVEQRDCSGRGTCDYTTGLCKCYSGYTGEGCQETAAVS